jgi:hypothetical protein
VLYQSEPKGTKYQERPPKIKGTLLIHITGKGEDDKLQVNNAGTYAVLMMTVFWDVAPCSLADTDPRS